jgi:tetratricopeptide (TPR) repeat protein
VSPNGTRDDASFSQARTDFIAGNYRQAELDIAQAIQQMPGNVDVHEFNALILFAMGDYDRAAAVAHTVLEAGPGWDWSILQTFYGSPDVYTAQLRALEHYVGDHASADAGARFLLAYHYLMLGHMKAADHQLARVVAMEPKDKLSANMLAALNNAPGIKAETTNTTPPPTPPVGPPLAADQLHGRWKASPMPGVTIETMFQPDGHFTWTATEAGQTQTFTGTYSLQNDRLMFTRTDGNTMDGVVTKEADGFKFKLNNAPPNEPGLQFSKAGG